MRIAFDFGGRDRADRKFKAKKKKSLIGLRQICRPHSCRMHPVGSGEGRTNHLILTI
jgi:hypothetical protein